MGSGVITHMPIVPRWAIFQWHAMEYFFGQLLVMISQMACAASDVFSDIQYAEGGRESEIKLQSWATVCVGGMMVVTHRP